MIATYRVVPKIDITNSDVVFVGYGINAPERGWNDSGHNFLVCRNGVILQGRWRTIRSIQQRKMVVSAHCPGQNDQIGIEHEHISGEKITVAQRNASARLMAWIASEYRLRKVLPVLPHSQFFPTDCPDNLRADIPGIMGLAQQILDAAGGTA